ncbi:MAG: glycosyl hydrolase family 18 protein [Lachnospiraceae bacterium]|nr:MAG: glycosyl hydrolase family 18 protein [Lachnospiraceae bacterium]
MKNKKLVLPLIFTVGIFIIVAAVFIIKKNMPCNDYMNLAEYYGESEKGYTVIAEENINKNKALYDDGHIYIDDEFVSGVLNKRFYWDANENLLIYTTATSVIKAGLDSKTYDINKSSNTKDYVIAKLRGDKLYIALDFIKEYTALEYKTYKNPNRVVLTYKFGDKQKWVQADEGAKLRFEPSIKSRILIDVKKKDKLRILEENTDKSGFDKVLSESGVIGYIKMSSLGDTYEYVPKTDFVEETYPHILLSGKVNLLWHQVTTQSANANLTNVLSGTKKVNVIAPTWFGTSDNNGNISSIASYDYVEKAHSMGIQVWGLCNDFAPDMKIGKVLSRTSCRERLEKNLLAEAIRYSLDGINIDFENVKKANGDDFIQFVRELGIMCRNNGIVLSIDNYPPASYSAYYSRNEQAAVADYVITMAYDEFYSGSKEAGPVSSISYVRNASENILKEVPANQSIIGLPFYSRLWKETTKNGETKLSSEACSMKYAEELISDAKAELKWNEQTGLEYAEYTKDNALYKIWLENSKSLAMKLETVNSHKMAGAAFWKAGMEKKNVWDTIEKYMAQ